MHNSAVYKSLGGFMYADWALARFHSLQFFFLIQLIWNTKTLKSYKETLAFQIWNFSHVRKFLTEAINWENVIMTVNKHSFIIKAIKISFNQNKFIKRDLYRRKFCIQYSRERTRREKFSAEKERTCLNRKHNLCFFHNYLWKVRSKMFGFELLFRKVMRQKRCSHFSESVLSLKRLRTA